MFWNEYRLSSYPELSKSLPFGSDLTLLLEQYIGQQTTIARKLCLHWLRHLRHKLLYVLLPVLGLMNNAHSCFNFFDNLAIVKTPFTHLDKGGKMHTQIDRIFKISLRKFIPSLVWTGNRKNGGILKRKLKVPSLVWNRKRFLGGVFEKIYWKNKNLLSIHRTDRRRVWKNIKLVDCKIKLDTWVKNP